MQLQEVNCKFTAELPGRPGQEGNKRSAVIQSLHLITRTSHDDPCGTKQMCPLCGDHLPPLWRDTPGMLQPHQPFPSPLGFLLPLSTPLPPPQPIYLINPHFF